MDNLPLVDTKKVILQNKNTELTSYMSTLTRLNILSSNTESLKSVLANVSGEDELGIEYQVSLVSLYQQASGGVDGPQLQLSLPNTTSVRTVADANLSLKSFADSLVKQREELQNKIVQLQKDIAEAAAALETANFQYTQLTTDRDLAMNKYQALYAQAQETSLDLERKNLAAKVASRAVEPQQPVSSGALIKTIIGGVLAFILTCFVVLVISWWRAPTAAKKT